MKSNQTVRVDINKANLVKNLQFAFANFSTFVAEIIQNSRRAGASKIEISRQGNALIFSDDGSGIADFQTLFTIGQSGWSGQTQSLENPFGMGFTSALFACETLTVDSNGQRLCASTQDLLAIREIAIVPGDVAQGTRLTLAGLKFDLQALEDDLVRIVRGFPIPVFYNGQPLDRPDALDTDGFCQTIFGWVRLKLIPTYNLDWHNMSVYLQGLLVAGDKNATGRTAVIHLDSSQYQAKLPDRDCLIDASERLQELRQYLRAFIHDTLAQKQREMDEVEFMKAFWLSASLYAPDLLRAHPVAPGSIFAHIGGLARFIHGGFSRPVSDLPFMAKAQFDAGSLIIVRGTAYVDLERDPASAIKRAYLRKLGGIVVEGELPAGHWLTGAPSLDDLRISYVPRNPTLLPNLRGFATELIEVCVCDEVEISGPWGTVLVDDVELTVKVPDEDVYRLYSPMACVRPGEGLEQVEDFTVDGVFNEDWERTSVAAEVSGISCAEVG